MFTFASEERWDSVTGVEGRLNRSFFRFVVLTFSEVWLKAFDVEGSVLACSET